MLLSGVQEWCHAVVSFHVIPALIHYIFRNVIRPVRPTIKGPLELSLDQLPPLASRCCLSSYLSWTARGKNEPLCECGRSLCCVAIRWAEKIPLLSPAWNPPTCTAWHAPASPQLTLAARRGGGSPRRAAGEVGRAPVSLCVSLLRRCENIPGLRRWTLSHSLTPSAHGPSPSHTGLWISSWLTHTDGGGTVTADCDRNGWRPLLPPSCLALYIAVSPPSVFHSLWRFCLCQAGLKPHMGASTSLSQLFRRVPFATFYLFPPACLPACLCPLLCIYIPSFNLVWGKFLTQHHLQLKLWCCISIWITVLWQTASTLPTCCAPSGSWMSSSSSPKNSLMCVWLSFCRKNV